MKLINYKWKRGVMLIATAMLLDLTLPCCSKPKTTPLDSIVREQKSFEEQNSIIQEKGGLEFALESSMSKEEVKKRIIDLIHYRIEKEVKEIVIENNFEYYDPLSELDKLKKGIEKSYRRGNREIVKIQNNVLALVYKDTTNGNLSKLTEENLGKYYPLSADYEEIDKINSNFYKKVINYFNRMKDKKGEKLKEIEEKEKFFDMFFKKEKDYFKSIYNKS